MKIIQNLAGIGDLTEQVIAADYLMNAKATVRNYGIALSEVTTPEVRKILRKQLDASINAHEQILKYMMINNYFPISDPMEQMNLNKIGNEPVRSLH
jgi:similar to spore coat protein